MNEAYEDEKLSRTQVYFWYKRFKDGRKSIADDSSSGRLLTSTTDRNIGQAYKEIRVCLRDAIRRKRNQLFKSNQWKLLHDDAPAHRAIIVQDYLAKHSVSVLPHPPYSADIAPCDFFFFPKLKMTLKGRRFSSSSEHSKKWVAAFKLGRISTEDEHRPGRPVESVTQENIDKIHVLVMLDRKMNSSSDRRDHGYSKNNSGLDYERTLGPQEAFCPLGSQTFDTRSKGCKEKVIFGQLALFEANPEEFVSRFVTMDETWAHHFTPESKQQSMQWRHSGSPPPKKAKTVPSAGKVMVSVF
ncbi:hypothetical protein LAZ67_19001985 [Cordylochernes scorpioides]|uniref:Transposase n=1 Tax=Cordylochernes scorpioides TaxID=51811 RepID=A0ABY6LMX0_9ARAC|nr:hypothetical protein LAZ67_19001985 [Cordylochernes scorpioides]